MSAIKSALVTIATILTIIIYLPPILILFAFIGAFGTMIISKKVASLRYDYNHGMTPYNQGIGYR